jgi:hypothetical protein
MTKTHKHQHTIPRVYLSSWLEPYTPAGQMAAIHIIAKESKEVRRKSPTKSFTSNDRYTVHLKDGERNLDVENYLGRIESDFQGVLQAVRNRQNLSTSRRAKLAVFTAAMMGRAPVQSDSFRRQLQPLEEIVEKAGALRSRPKSFRNTSETTLPITLHPPSRLQLRCFSTWSRRYS